MSFSAFELIFFAIIILGGLSGAIAWAYKYKPMWDAFMKAAPYFLINFYANFIVFSVLISIVLVVLIAIYLRRAKAVRKKILSKVLPPEGTVINESTANAIVENPKWKIVEEHINSNDANKWKLAILEADIILGEMLDKMNLQGEGIGEKLKNVEASDFDHIEQAWEAHKIRNAIAHQGSDFLLTKNEAERVIKLYHDVFEEFEII